MLKDLESMHETMQAAWMTKARENRTGDADRDDGSIVHLPI